MLYIQKEHIEMKSKRPGKAECLSSDIIRTLPQTVLETILCILPTEEAARTSILSREWRYKWTKIPKLEFYMSQLSKRLTKEEDRDVICKLFYDLHQILLLHKSPIHEFTLYIDIPEAYEWEADHDSFGLDGLILHLSKIHTVKKLKLYGWECVAWFKLPTSLFSLHHLTDLYIAYVDIDLEPIFNGFGSLRSLVLEFVRMPTKTMLHLLSNCPSLKRLNLIKGELIAGDKGCTTSALVECFHVIEHLSICTFGFEWLVLDTVPKELSVSLFHLKYFYFDDISYVEVYGLAFLLMLIKCSPNLKKIKLQMEWGRRCYEEEYNAVWEEYSDVCLEHLIELEVDTFTNLKPQMEFVKFILARSPKLKKVCMANCFVSVEERLEMLQVLLEAPRASPVIITVR